MSERVKLVLPGGIVLSIDPAAITGFNIHSQLRELPPKDGWAHHEATTGGTLTLTFDDIRAVQFDYEGEAPA